MRSRGREDPADRLGARWNDARRHRCRPPRSRCRGHALAERPHHRSRVRTTRKSSSHTRNRTSQDCAEKQRVDAGHASIEPPSPDGEAPMISRGSGARVAKVIRHVFGVAELRPGQEAVIDAVLAKRHTLAIMPTGAGKSLCYQVPAMLMPGITVIVSPLIALMRDQVDKLSALGLEAVQVNSAISTGDIRRARAKIGRRAVEFVFTTPEQLASTDLHQLLAGA